MNTYIQNPKLIFEEQKAIKLFLWLFYIMYYAFDIFYTYFVPALYYHKPISGREGLGLWMYVLVLCILPLGIYYLRKERPFIVKYIYIYSYIGLDFIDNLIKYWGSSDLFKSGNIVEVLFILFSPIFVNKKFFWTVSLGVIAKDILLGLILQDLNVIIPVVIYIILSTIAYVILVRFYSYIKSLSSVYEELHQKEKLAVIGQMATAIGHEIRNPLSSLKGFTQLQQERFPNTNDYFPIMIQEIDRINFIVDDLMYLGKPRSIKFEKASIEEIIAYTLSITQQQAERQGVNVETMIAGPLPRVECDSKQLKQVFINLIKNAIESMKNGGKIDIKVKVMEGKKMQISIQDEGCGISDNAILNIGEPFFTTKKDGTGLGLMVSNQIIRDHLGEIKINSKVGEGTTIAVILPIKKQED